jgi:hypothetical protein
VRAAMAAAMSASLLIAPAARANQNVQVLMVGDSVAKLTAPQLQRYLPGIELTVNAVAGSDSGEVVKLFRESYEPSQTVVVFDAGTDDPEDYVYLGGNLPVVARAIGDRCMVVPTIHGRGADAESAEGKSKAVFEFAETRPTTQVPEWSGAADLWPQFVRADGVTPTPAGAAYRARLLAAGVRDCLAAESGKSANQPRPKTVKIDAANVFSPRYRTIYQDVATETIRRAAALILLRALL